MFRNSLVGIVYPLNVNEYTRARALCESHRARTIRLVELQNVQRPVLRAVLVANGLQEGGGRGGKTAGRATVRVRSLRALQTKPLGRAFTECILPPYHRRTRVCDETIRYSFGGSRHRLEDGILGLETICDCRKRNPLIK